MIESNPEINKDLIFSKLSVEYIYSHYLGNNYKVGKAISSPWRKDRNPSFVLFYSNTSELLWIDFGRSESGDVIEFVKRLFNLDYIKSLQKIYSDFNLGKTTNNNLFKLTNNNNFINNIIKDNPKEFKDIQRDFNNIDLQYWKEYGWNIAMLNYYEITCVEKLYVDDNIRWLHSNANPIYKFTDQGSIKYYRPKSPKHSRWLGNKSNIIQGWTQLPQGNIDNLIITKSRKDIGTLLTLGYYSIAPISEGYRFSKDQIDSISKKAIKKYILMDNDRCGHSQVNYILKNVGNEFYDSYIPIFIKDVDPITNKRLDISDYYKLNKEENSKKIGRAHV